MQKHYDGQNNNWDYNYWSSLFLEGAIYLIEGSVWSKDHYTLGQCPLKGGKGADVPAMIPVGALIRVGLIALCAAIALKRKHH